jgi:hypothetical protein
LPRQTNIFVAPYLIDTDSLPETGHGNRHRTDTPTDTEIATDIDKDIDTDIDRDMDKNTDMELEHLCFPYGAIVTIASCGLPVTHHSASSNSAMNF